MKKTIWAYFTLCFVVLVTANVAVADVELRFQQSQNQIAPVLPTLNHLQGHRLTEECAWAPHDRSVCRARAFCVNDPLNKTCAKYCTVNPDDVVCGDSYRQILPHVDPWRNDSPYPWARNGGPYCRRNAYSIFCISRQGKYYRQ
jgi:hypothetical protein